jgi:hypothetical protein
MKANLLCSEIDIEPAADRAFSIMDRAFFLRKGFGRGVIKADGTLCFLIFRS